MFGSVEHYSSSMRKRRVNLFGSRILRVAVLALVLFLLVQRFLVSTFRVESVSMEPQISPADRVIVSSITFGPRIPFSRARIPGFAKPERGDIVVVQPPFFTDGPIIARIFEPLVSFLTLQKATLNRDFYGGRVNGYMVKRVVGMPGDTVRMTDFSLFIRPRGASNFMVEEQIVPVRYGKRTVRSDGNWPSQLPFSGNTEEITLGDDEYFVLGDNRPESSDSRSWGPVSMSRILGKVIFRYWPPRSIGKL